MIRCFLLVVLSLVLPLQSSWAAAASACDHQAGVSHFGHHEHKQCASDFATGAGVGDQAPDQQHPDCQQCHGVGVACVGTLTKLSTPLPVASFASNYWYAVPEPPLERLLRPPLTLVA